MAGWRFELVTPNQITEGETDEVNLQQKSVGVRTRAGKPN
jgi:hypothetical protein